MAELSLFGIGVATADPELRTVGEKNTSVCTVNLAFNRSYKDKNDEWQNEPCFVRAQVWGNRAIKMAELVKKGQPIYVNGYLKQDTWTDKKDETKRTSFSMTLRDFQLCQKSAKPNGSQEPVAATAATAPSTAPAQETNDADDIPF